MSDRWRQEVATSKENATGEARSRTRTESRFGPVPGSWVLAGLLVGTPVIMAGEGRAAPQSSPTGRENREGTGKLRVDGLVAGIDGGSQLGLYLELVTLYWPHLMVIPLRVQSSGIQMLPLFIGGGNKVGSLVGLGAFTGPRQRDSHWFVIGAELLIQLAASFGRQSKTTLYGLAIPLGYDFRRHFGEGLRWVWGIRVYLAVTPLYKPIYKDVQCEPDNPLCVERAPRVVAPVMAGLCFFIGI